MLRIIALIGNVSLLILLIILGFNAGGIYHNFVEYDLVPWDFFTIFPILIIGCILNIYVITTMKMFKTLVLIGNICLLGFGGHFVVSTILGHEKDSSFCVTFTPLIILCILNIYIILVAHQRKS